MSTQRKEYIVTLVKGEDHDDFSKEMCREDGSSSIPSRCVDIINSRVASKVNTHYDLTEEEVKCLLKDPRVQSITLPVEKDSHAIIHLNSIQSGPFIKLNTHASTNYTINATGGSSSQNNFFGTQSNRVSGHRDYAKILHTYIPVTGGSFTKDAFEREKGTGEQYNRAMSGLPNMCYLRPVISGGPASGQPTSSTAYGFGMQQQAFSEFDEYRFSMDGTGVDVVIQDSGIQADHPEFFDEDGVSRVQQINWYHTSAIGTAASSFPLSTQMPSAHYTDRHGHGTHVAGTIAGRTYGWAKNARIYAHKIAIGGSVGTPASECISLNDSFDLIKLWHRNKPIDPKTGYKRPTVVNMSWGSSWYPRNGNGKPIGHAGYIKAESPLSALSRLNNVLRTSAIPSSGAGFIPMTGTLAKGPLSSLYPSGIAQFKSSSASNSEWRKFAVLNPGDYLNTSENLVWIWNVPAYNPRFGRRRLTNIKFGGTMYYDTISGTGSHPTSTPPSVLSTALSATNIVSLTLSGSHIFGNYDFDPSFSGYVQTATRAWNKYPYGPITGYKSGTSENLFISQSIRGFVETISHQGNKSELAIRSRFGFNTNLAVSMVSLPDSSDQKHTVLTPVGSVRVNAYDQDVGEMIDEGIHVVVAAGNDRRYMASPKHSNWGNLIGATPSALPTLPPLSSGPLSSESVSGNYILHLPQYQGYDAQHYARGPSPGDRTTNGKQQRNFTVGSLRDSTFNEMIMDKTVKSHGVSSQPISAGQRYEYSWSEGSNEAFQGARGQTLQYLSHSGYPAITGIIGGHYNTEESEYSAIPSWCQQKMFDLIARPYVNHATPNHRSGSGEPFRTTQSSLESGTSMVETSSILSGAKYMASRFSNYGSGIDIYAFGENIQSCFPTEPCVLLGTSTAKNTYPLDTNFKIHKIGGTSMAAPQVAGVLALTLQAHPEYTPVQAKASLQNDALTGIIMNGCRGEGNYGVNTTNIRHYPFFNGNFGNRLDIVTSATVPFTETPEREGLNSFMQGSDSYPQPVNTKATSAVLFLNNKYRNSRASSFEFINIL